MRRLLIILVVLILVSVPVVGFSATERRVALVIGNSAYKNAPLRNPANDATDISRALKRLGFKVTMLRNADQRKMKSSIREFGKQLSKGGVGLFYYAGHGMQVEGRNYLIPVGARVEDPSDVEFEAVDAGRVLGKMEVAGNDMNIVVLDACRDNPFSRSWRSGQKGLARMDAPKGSYISYATAPGSVAADGSGRNGTFTKSLLRHIEVPGLTLESVMKRVRKDVIQETGSKQIPWSSSSITGDFFFDPSRSISIVSKDPSVVNQPLLKAPKSSPVSQGSSTDLETRELRYAKSLYDRGKKSEAKRIVSGLLKSKDDTVLSEAMYSQIMWGFASNDRESVEKLKAYYPDFKWIESAEKAVGERERVRKIEAEKRRQAEVEKKRLAAIKKKRADELSKQEGERRRRAEAKKQSFIIQMKPSNMQFVYIKPGTFMMGSPPSEKGRYDNETQHKVTLTKGFYMQTTEVTQGQWQAVMGNNPSYFKNCGENCPVERVTWAEDAERYIRKLNDIYKTNKFRLPTEAEWEYAARAGNSTALSNGNISTTGCASDSNLDVMGWYCGNSKVRYSGCANFRIFKEHIKCSGTHPVGQKKPNAYGLYDMHGNVWEWCQDIYGDYHPGPVTNPTGPFGKYHVTRGGSWDSRAKDCRSAVRRGGNAGTPGTAALGFRLAYTSD